MADFDELIETFAYWTHWKPAKPQAIDEADKARATLRAAIAELEQERDNLKTVLHGNQDADYDKQLQIETLKAQLAEAEAKREWRVSEANDVGRYWVEKLNDCVRVLKEVRAYPIAGTLEAEAMKSMVNNFLKSNGYDEPPAPPKELE